jgi:hypothetical protein
LIPLYPFIVVCQVAIDKNTGQIGYATLEHLICFKQSANRASLGRGGILASDWAGAFIVREFYLTIML